LERQHRNPAAYRHASTVTAIAAIFGRRLKLSGCLMRFQAIRIGWIAIGMALRVSL
jgi:hypothetical protein